MISKKEARQLVKNKRNSLSVDECKELSTLIVDRLCKMKEVNSAKTVFLYSSIKNEVDTLNLAKYCKERKIKIAYPKTVGDDIIFYYMNNITEAESGYMGILEPQMDANNLADLKEGVVICPGLAFDKNCNRCGYGKGFYDRFLKENPKLITIGIAYDFQVFEKIETDEFDIPLDFIVTEASIYTNNNK